MKYVLWAATTTCAPRPFSQGGGGVTSRNSMPLFNVLWNSSFFWDGRAVSLEDQALEPVQEPVEMGEDWDRVVAKLECHPEYPAPIDRRPRPSRQTRHSGLFENPFRLSITGPVTRLCFCYFSLD